MISLLQRTLCREAIMSSVTADKRGIMKVDKKVGKS